MAQTFTAGSFIGRWFFALVLVLGTYNPTEYSYVSWVFAKGTHLGLVVALVGLVLLIGWIIYIHRKCSWGALLPQEKYASNKSARPHQDGKV